MAAWPDDQALTNPALTTSYSLSSDIYLGLFDWVFAHHLFDRWARKDGHWQLHCVGSPGSGKTTIAALAARQLSQRYQDGGAVVVSVFIQDDIVSYDLNFLEDFLQTIFNQLEASDVRSTEADEDYDDYQYERFGILHGGRSIRRVQLLRDAVLSLLANISDSKPTFLILDGIDRCSSPLKALLEMELSKMQDKGLSILLTSRPAVFYNLETTCDHSRHDDPPDGFEYSSLNRAALDMYWKCKTCNDILCFPCRDKDSVCETCLNNNELWEEYEYVNLVLDQIPRSALVQFIAWDLEREHGDLGLHSDARKPPLSTLGRSLLHDRNLDSAQGLVKDIVEVSSGNLAIIRARLDKVHEAESIIDLERKSDRLPVNIVAIFDAAVKGIESQPHEKRDLALKAIVITSRVEDYGMETHNIREWLQRSKASPTRSGEDIIEAAKGFLVATTEAYPQRLRVYNDSFYRYAVERYNSSLHRINSELVENEMSQSPRRFNAQSPMSTEDVRFEPLNISEVPTRRTTFKLDRTVTSLDSVEETPRPAYIVRKGTRAWK